MGVDLALGAVVLLAAIRGWLKGFLLQAIRLGGLVGCVYTAAPIRDQARPFVAPQLPSIRPELLDRLLWWLSAVAAYVVLVGLTSLAVGIWRRRLVAAAPGAPPASAPLDSGAGFFLGAFKGLVTVVFLAAALQEYAVPRLKGVSWVDDQVRTSQALKWNTAYQPASRIWTSTPVQHFVQHVQRMGLSGAREGGGQPGSESHGSAEPKPLQTASGQPPRLMIPAPSSGDLSTRGLDAELAEAVEAIQRA